MNVRVPTASDVGALLDVEEEFRRAGVSPWALMGAAWFERKIAHDQILVADAEDGFAGYVAWTVLWTLPWIEFIRLHERARRRGIGRALVRALEERLRAGGYRTLLSSTTGGEADPLAWHRAVGFEDAGSVEWKLWPGAPDEVLLARQL